MPTRHCVTITLNSDSTGCFYTGDIVTGTINLNVSKDLAVENINLEVIGESKAQWTRASPTIPYIKIYSEKKKVLYVKIINIFGNFQRGKRIPVGVYSYPFHFALPQDLPSTFKSSIAKVYYVIKIKSKPKYKISQVFSFNVIGKVNINHINEMLTPWIHEFKRTFRNSKEILLIYFRTYKGIASRQTVPFEVIIKNENKIRISEIIITLIQKLQYTLASGWAVQEKQMCKVKNKKLTNTISEMCNMNMEIPQVIPSTVYMTNPMIDISYVFRVQVCYPFRFDHYEDLPVTVASVPVIHHDF